MLTHVHIEKKKLKFVLPEEVGLELASVRLMRRKRGSMHTIHEKYGAVRVIG